ncbi:FYV7 [Candida jiufengensis]|uniref:FYV7 n=1 Tax=Candida jiufengensis TaxID=497108 RepID=UPI0022259EE0|nr:FYV7 [Candida jiufengensis]KAI5956434.1 FYV7 [Candida jiufengensis]
MVGRQPSNGSSSKYNTKNRKKFVDRKEAKTQDIQRALTHRARLRKNYFKLLKKEGIDEHPRDEGKLDHEEEDSEVEHSQDDSEAEQEEEEEEAKTSSHKKPTKSSSTYTKSNPPPRLTYAERAAIAKERRSRQRHDKKQEIQEKIEMIARQQKIRELRKQQLKLKTKTGQPSMGPRINNLLDKIRRDRQN